MATPKGDSDHARIPRAPLETAHADRRQAEKDLQALRAGTIARVKGLSCGSAISVAHLRSTHCPACNTQDFLLTQGEAEKRDRLVAKAKDATARGEAARARAREPLRQALPGG